MGRKSTAGATIDKFFGSTKWKEIHEAMAGQNPTVFIIVKAPTGKVHQVYVKSGADFNEGLTEALAKPEIEYQTRNNIDALSPTPARFVPVEASPAAPIDNPEHYKQRVPAAPILLEVPEPAVAPAPEPAEGGVDLKPGMKVKWREPGEKNPFFGDVEQIWEAANQVLVNDGGIKRIISPDQIVEIAS